LPFEFNLQRYNEGQETWKRRFAAVKQWWGCARCIQLTHGLQPPGDPTLGPMKRKTGFKPLLSNSTCTATQWGVATHNRVAPVVSAAAKQTVDAMVPLAEKARDASIAAALVVVEKGKEAMTRGEEAIMAKVRARNNAEGNARLGATTAAVAAGAAAAAAAGATAARYTTATASTATAAAKSGAAALAATLDENGPKDGILSPGLVWIDRYCIHQVHPALKQKGLETMEEVLVDRTQTLLILYADKYLERIWCVYEIATFVKARGSENVRLVPIEDGRRLFVFTTFLFLPVVRPLHNC
jgi:hypothetical protein